MLNLALPLEEQYKCTKITRCETSVSVRSDGLKKRWVNVNFEKTLEYIIKLWTCR